MIRALLSTIVLVTLTSAALADTDDGTWTALMELTEEQIDQLAAAANAAYAIQDYAHGTGSGTDKECSSQQGQRSVTVRIYSGTTPVIRRPCSGATPRRSRHTPRAGPP